MKVGVIASADRPDRRGRHSAEEPVALLPKKIGG